MADRRQTLRTDVVVDTSKAEGGLKDLGRSADRASVDVGKLATELKQAEKPMRDLGDTSDKTGHRVSDAMDNSRDSTLGAASAMGEAFGQGGSATDALGSMGEVVESVSESFGPFGALAALAGGAIVGAFGAAAAKAEELKQRAHDVFDALVQGQGQLDEAFKKQQIQDFIKNNEELVTQVSRLLGPQGLQDLGDAIGGNDAAYESLNRRVEVTLDQMKQEKANLEALTLAGQPLTKDQTARLTLLNQQIPVYEELNSEIDDQAGAIGQARHEHELFNGMLGTASSSMNAYSTSVTQNSTDLQRNIGWQMQQTAKLYDAATAAQVAKHNVELLNDAYAKRTARGEAPAGAVAYIEGKGWVDRAGKPVARAAGGPVEAGRAYTVGEYGRETFIPSTDGTILPNSATRGGGGQVTIHQTIVTNDPARVAAQTARALARAQFRGA